jgi:hypothetical protein
MERLAGRQLTDDGNVEITSRDLREREPVRSGDRLEPLRPNPLTDQRSRKTLLLDREISIAR